MTFSKKEALIFSWGHIKEHSIKLISITFVYLALQIVLSYLTDLLTADGSFGESLLTFGVWVVTFFLTMGYIRVFLNILDEKEFDLITLFEERDEFLNFVGTSILQMLIVGVGLLLLIVPGIYWGLKYSQAPYLVIDKGLRPFEAFKESSSLMKGVKWEYLFFSIILGVINIIGLILFGIGLLVTLPLSSLAMVYVYRKLNTGAYGVVEKIESTPVSIENTKEEK